MRTRALALLAALLVSGTVLAAPRATSEPLAFVPVPDPWAPAAASTPQPRRALDRQHDVLGVPPLPPARPAVSIPPPHLIVVARDSGVPQPSSHRTSGTASWYCGHGSACTRGFDASCRCAAAGPSIRRLLGADWRGRRVTVAASGRSVRVTLIDWCQCPHGRLLDLYSDAFERLAPLSKGLVKVSVSW